MGGRNVDRSSPKDFLSHAEYVASDIIQGNVLILNVNALAISL